ncbi:hypothetical protein SY88_05765 [Clostridiales bacterium PH28_bin88]|nr:hypothetical protein SY88_05765 [Clostridiales bacterium PH28_bin88]
MLPPGCRRSGIYDKLMLDQPVKMGQDQEGKRVLESLGIESYVAVADNIYDTVEELVGQVKGR